MAPQKGKCKTAVTTDKAGKNKKKKSTKATAAEIHSDNNEQLAEIEDEGLLANEEETAYERLLRKVEANRKKREANAQLQNSPVEVLESAETEATEQVPKAARFVEEDNFIDMEQTREFPSASEDEFEDEDELNTRLGCSNNNATVTEEQSAKRSTSSNCATKEMPLKPPGRVDSSPAGEGNPNKSGLDLAQTFCLMQNFMLQQGLINKSLNEAEVKEFLDKSMTGDTGEAADKGHREGTRNVNKDKAAAQKMPKKGVKGKETNKSVPVIPREVESEMTIYKRVIPQVQLGNNNKTINNDVGLPADQIENFIEEVRHNMNQRKVSSSDEMMDTSDESNNTMLHDSMNFLGAELNEALPGRSDDPRFSNRTEAQSEPKSDLLIKESEKSKTRLFEVSGKSENSWLTSQMDEDYQMIDAHVDETVRGPESAFEHHIR